jgi:hypothetical protein
MAGKKLVYIIFRARLRISKLFDTGYNEKGCRPMAGKKLVYIIFRARLRISK